MFRGTKEDHITSEETEVAIKMIPPIESDVQYRDFLREAQIMRQLEHENIVKIHEFREDTPMLIIMEYVSQGSLQTYVSSNRPNLRVEDLLHFASNIANVSISNSWFVTIFDFLTLSRECDILNKIESSIVIWRLETFSLVTTDW